ncbi:MAG: TetR/AcrR family transcriptional regulator [Actinomycetes bacterium]
MTITGRARPLPADERRAAIAQAALPLVLAHGRSVTTRQIAGAAGVAEGTLFHVFDDKDALIAAVVASVLQPGQVAAELAAIGCAQPLHDRVVQIVEVLRQRMRLIFELMTALGMSGPPEVAGAELPERRATRLKQLTDTITALLQPDADRLRYPPAETARLIRLFTFAASHPALTDESPLSASQIADVLLSGITLAPTRHADAHGGR